LNLFIAILLGMNNLSEDFKFEFDWKEFKNKVLKDIPPKYHNEYLETFDMKLYFEHKVK
jgi:hypothetical protein